MFACKKKKRRRLNNSLTAPFASTHHSASASSGPQPAINNLLLRHNGGASSFIPLATRPLSSSSSSALVRSSRVVRCESAPTLPSAPGEDDDDGGGGGGCGGGAGGAGYTMRPLRVAKVCLPTIRGMGGHHDLKVISRETMASLLAAVRHHQQAHGAPHCRPVGGERGNNFHGGLPLSCAGCGRACGGPEVAQFAAWFDRLVVIDTRFAYEFAGGHIMGALNLNQPRDVEQFMFTYYGGIDRHRKADRDRYLLGNHQAGAGAAGSEPPPAPGKPDSAATMPAKPMNPQNGARTAIVFHCEFSANRAPKMLRFFRRLDREILLEQYPRLARCFSHVCLF